MIKKISITGGIGCGKSTVITMLKQLGYCVWDADVFATLAMAIPSVEERIKILFGPKSYLAPAQLNREWIRNQIFSNISLKNELENILHPEIEKIFMDRLRILEAEDVSCWIFYEASLIFEKKRHSFFDANVLMTADKNKRIQRVQKSKLLSLTLIKQIIAQQMPDKDKKKYADFIINNSSTLAHLQKKVMHLVQFLKKKF